MALDILFIHPGNQKRIYQMLAKNLTAIAPPVWTALLANSSREAGCSTAIYDVHVSGWDEQVPSELCAKYNPQLVVVMVYGHTPSASTQTMPAAMGIIKDIKAFNKDIPVAIGGLHPSALPQQTLREVPADFLIQGEGVYTIPALAGYVKGSTARDDVPGLWYRDGDKVGFTHPAVIVQDLDAELGNYAWDLLPELSTYRAHNMHCFQDFERSERDDFLDVRSPYVSLNTSLGCPFNCHYCCINSIFGKPGIRYWSEERVLEWFDYLHEKGVRNIRLDDELFILSPKRVESICDSLIERGYDFNIMAYARIDTIRHELLSKMQQAGFTWICVGIESAAEKVRNAANKKIGKDIEEAVDAIHGNGMYVLANYIFGLPEDDLSTMEQTLQLAVDLNCEFSNFYAAMPYPGSKLYSDMVADGAVMPEWIAFSQHSYETQPTPTNYVSAKEVLRFRDEAFIRYHESPVYLNMLREKFGPKVVSHMEDVLKHRLARRLLEKDD